MAKLKAPFLSFGATGTVGQALTVSRYKGLHVAKKVPLHPDAQSAAQLAHRELYSHARDYWLTLTPTEKATLLTEGRPSHITGYNLLLHRYLKDLLQLEAWWPLNDGGVPTARDYSLLQTDGTVYGCTAAPDFCGQLNNAFFFDGINDYVVATTPQLNFTSSDFSVVCRIRPQTLATWFVLIMRALPGTGGWSSFVGVNGAINVQTHQLPAFQITASFPGSLASITWATVGFTRHADNIDIYVDGIDRTQVHANHIDPAPIVTDTRIGILQDDVSQPFHGRLCDVRAYSRALTPAQHLAHHQRYCVHPPR